MDAQWNRYDEALSSIMSSAKGVQRVKKGLVYNDKGLGHRIRMAHALFVVSMREAPYWS
jgi:hypothetical protein